MNREDLEGLGLTLEGRLEIIYKYVNNSHEMVAQKQLSKVIEVQTDALQKYQEGKITLERLTEKMGLNFYVLHNAFEVYKNWVKVN